MKLPLFPIHSHRARGGWALMMVMVLAVGSLLVVASVLKWSSVTGDVTARNNEYYATTYAAEAATEKVLSAVVSDYENYGESIVYSRLATYSNYIPSTADSPYWGNYKFSAGPGQSNSTVINRINPTNVVMMGPPYNGLLMLCATYEIISTAMNNSSSFGINAAVGQQINLGTIPIFQFAIFYENTMEVDPGANMLINGFAHGNNNIYLDPNSGVSLTFSNDVSSSGSIVLAENPLDPSSRPATSNPTFDGYHLSGVDPLILPVGTNNSGSATNISQNVNAILQIPPAGVSPTSSTGSNYLYNQADLIILISNNSVSVTSGVNVNNQATIISNGAWSQWLNTNANMQFYDQRQGINIQTAYIDVGNLAAWSATNNTLRPALGNRDLDSIFIADERSNSNMVVTTNYNYTTNFVFTNTTTHPPNQSTNLVPPITTNTTLTQSTNYPGNGTYLGSVSTNKSVHPYVYQFSLINSYGYEWITGVTATPSYATNYNIVSQAGVVLTNGITLPSLGLSVVTPDPLYIIGNYNVSTNGTPVNLGTFNTSQTRPAAVMADAVTILSSKWNINNSSNAISSRTATNDTVNAAILTGNVASDGNNYSGGVENFPRFLENWSGYTFTYNGSMVCMFNSQVATAPWPGTGTVYNPPTRNWAYDLNFNNSLKQPPLTPRVISVNRGAWTFLNPNTVRF